MPAALGLIEAHSTGEHDVGLAKELLFQSLEFRRRVFEGREFVHAVIDADILLQRIGELQGHGGVVPSHQLVVLDACHEILKQNGDSSVDLNSGLTLRQYWRHNFQAWRNRLAAQKRYLNRLEEGFLEEHNGVVGCGARHQMLRALKNKVPPQVGKTYQEWVVKRHEQGVGYSLIHCNNPH